MTEERHTLDIARELRDVAKPGGFMAELLTEAAERLEHLHEELHQAHVSIAIREGQRDRAAQFKDVYRDKLQEAYHGLAELWGLLTWEDGEEREEIPAAELERTLRGCPDFMDWTFAEEVLADPTNGLTPAEQKQIAAFGAGLRAGIAEQPTRTTCGYMFIGNVGEFTCDHYAGHEGKHRNYIAEFEWTDEVTR